MRALITGSAGFIGYHLVKKLMERGDSVVGIDNLNDYYDVNLKYSRLSDTGIDTDNIVYGRANANRGEGDYTFIKMDLTDSEALFNLFELNAFDLVINLAAQAGVRYSLVNPGAYIDSNVSGFVNILECCRSFDIKKLIYASSSSVYGLNSEMPFSIKHRTDRPASLYAATKKCNELMAHTYSHLYQLPTIGLRFFTVYGPWGRPDMALFKFVEAIVNGQAFPVYNNGIMKRDFTYIDDVIKGITQIIDNSQDISYGIYNLGRGESVSLLNFIKEIENSLDIEALIQLSPMQKGDVYDTWADISATSELFDYAPETSIATGVKSFVNWYKDFYLACELPLKN